MEALSSSIALVSVLEQAQHHLFTHALQGLLPPDINPYSLKQVLDLNCHTGTWSVDLALAYPGVIVTGLDSDPDAIEMARQSVRAAKIARARFYQSNLHETFHFADNSFDLVHLFVTQTLFRPEEWGGLLQECQRVLKPGGAINLVGFSLGPGSSAAYMRFGALIDQLMRLMHYSFADKPGTSTPGVYFCHMLQTAGFAQTRYAIHPINLGGWDNAGGRATCQLLLRGLLNTREILVEHELIGYEEFDALIEQKRKDIVEADFCATGALISAFAFKRENA